MLHDSRATVAFYDDRENDTIVVESPPLPSAEVVVQLLVPKMNADDPDTAWHRPFLRKPMTACEVEYHSEFVTSRPESYDQTIAPLCRRGCFTVAELRDADRVRAEEKRATGEHAPLTLHGFLDDETRPTNPKRKK